jgi:hypothetical protein
MKLFDALLDALASTVVLLALCWSVYLTAVFVFVRFADKLTSDDMHAMVVGLVLVVFLAATRILRRREE